MRVGELEVNPFESKPEGEDAASSETGIVTTSSMPLVLKPDAFRLGSDLSLFPADIPASSSTAMRRDGKGVNLVQLRMNREARIAQAIQATAKAGEELAKTTAEAEAAKQAFAQLVNRTVLRNTESNFIERRVAELYSNVQNIEDVAWEDRERLRRDVALELYDRQRQTEDDYDYYRSLRCRHT
jgi:hypothetical protein